MHVTGFQLCLLSGVPTLAVLLGILMNGIQQNTTNTHLNHIESRVDARFNSVDARFNNLEVKFDTLIGKVIDVDNRVTRIEAKLDIR
jgi:hypothetical protein